MRKSGFATAVATLPIVCLLWSGSAAADDWPQYGGDIRNSRNQPAETTIGPGNVGSLEVRWILAAGGDVSANPAVVDGYAYVGDWAGNFYKIDVATGAQPWGGPRVVGNYPGSVPGSFTRNTPAVADGRVIFGDQGGRMFAGAKMYAIDADTGDLLWITQVHPNPTAIVTTSPTVHDGVVYVGLASLEEAFAAFIPNYPCCNFEGTMVALDAATGQILWETSMVPAGFSGNAIWGSAPSIDVERNQVYVSTGNNYSSPADYKDCIANAPNETRAQACNPDDNYFDSVLALDLDTGAVNWSQRVLPYDTWHVGCAPFLIGAPQKINCDYDEGPDFDFGQSPILYTVDHRGLGNGGNGTENGVSQSRDFVGVGQKSGVYWALNPDNGKVRWSTRTGPGGLAGGHQWGSAEAGGIIYTANANSGFQPWTLPSGAVTNAAIFSAIDGRTGDILWQTASPAFFSAGAPATVANGVVYVCSMDPTGQMYALDAASGAVLWNRSAPSVGSCGGGATISDGTVLWGSGYSSIGGVPGNILWAFSLP